MPGQRLAAGLFAAVAALTMGFSAHAQEKKIKIGVIFDLTGPLGVFGVGKRYPQLIGRDRRAYAG